MAGLLRRQGVAIALENLAGRIAFEEREVAGRGGIGGAALRDDDALVEWGVERGGDFNPATLVPEFRREDKRARNETSIGVTSFDELGGLRDVFTGDNFESSGRGEAEVIDDLQGRAAVGRGDGICDGEFLYRGIIYGSDDVRDLDPGLGGPEHEATDGEGREGFGVGVAGFDEGLRVIEIGREENVVGRAVGDLRDQVARSAGGASQSDVGRRLLERGVERIEGVDEVGGRGDRDGGGSRRGCRCRGGRERGRKPGEEQREGETKTEHRRRRCTDASGLATRKGEGCGDGYGCA